MMKKLLFLPGLAVSVCLFVFFSHPVVCWGESATSFLPTWKLLNEKQKQEFMAGYLHGWKDATAMIDIAIDYTKENPDKAVEGLQSLRRVYEVKGLRPASLVSAVNEFFRDPKNAQASLSAAVSFAKAQ